MFSISSYHNIPHSVYNMPKGRRRASKYFLYLFTNHQYFPLLRSRFAFENVQYRYEVHTYVQTRHIRIVRTYLCRISLHIENFFILYFRANARLFANFIIFRFYNIVLNTCLNNNNRFSAFVVGARVVFLVGWWNECTTERCENFFVFPLLPAAARRVRKFAFCKIHQTSMYQSYLHVCAKALFALVTGRRMRFSKYTFTSKPTSRIVHKLW